MMGTELKFSTANHPQTDGQTERVNALVEDYLRHYVSASQRNWVDLLDVAQFSYNLHKSSATGMSPFELAYGQQPTTPHEISVQRTGGSALQPTGMLGPNRSCWTRRRIAWPKHSAE
ncbi:UNVERIFIED_CONTAM: Transposon Ty3-I Gag-Pol polyprotein [Sesamum angustifolium]|uniref:Transposon Ty3-I Gag-Pol polyprotein n=1 Tax=Sesamum angustifolium TaxID=2727405 RepID=A0AAW2IR26_9LAMI